MLSVRAGRKENGATKEQRMLQPPLGQSRCCSPFDEVTERRRHGKQVNHGDQQKSAT
jgi:hypothetical protein